MVVVARLSESTWWGYEFGLMQPAHWDEVFDSDAYESLPQGGGYHPGAAGNPWGIDASDVGRQE